MEHINNKKCHIHIFFPTHLRVEHIGIPCFQQIVCLQRWKKKSGDPLLFQPQQDGGIVIQIVENIRSVAEEYTNYF